MRAIIRIEKLSKRYRIGSRGAARYETLRDTIVRGVRMPLRAARRMLSGSQTEDRGAGRPEDAKYIWALRDLSLDIMPGEVVGIVGRNGAGKSTLLKVLSRITAPTSGRAELYGRVGSLLEVGTGFHPELTGRENIYLMGAILGMRRAEINRKFDEMLAFAGVERFVDTPIKFYSSGMFVRLAFAVAAHLETEILLVDEVLAVGDAAFQRKCLGKIGDVARHGRTVLFVSHNMASIEALCSSCILINGGELEAKGDAAQIVMRYMAAELSAHEGSRALIGHQGRTGISSPLMKSVSLLAGAGQTTGMVRMDEPLDVRVEFEAEAAIRPVLGVSVRTAEGMPLFGVNNRWTNDGIENDPIRAGTITCSLGKLPLMPGMYFLDLFFGDFGDPTRDLDVVREAISFEVAPADIFGSGALTPASEGPLLWRASWRAQAGRESKP